MGKKEEGNPSILIVEDDQEIRKGMKQLLARKGYRVIVVADEQDAMETISRKSIDLIVLEQDLPPVEVLALGHRIRRHLSPKRQIPLVVLSASTGRVPGKLAVGYREWVINLEDFSQLEVLIKDLIPRRRKAAANDA
jgi:DNA-binding response OmpR family regulator